MAGGFSIKSDVSKLSETLKKRALKLGPAQARAMQVTVTRMASDLKRNELTGKAGASGFWGKTGAGGDSLAVVTGHTRRTIVSRVFSRALSIIGVIGSPLKSFAMHEFGGTIRGRPYLRIPTAWMKKPSGQDRLSGRSARTLPGTAVFRSRAGNLFVWQRRPTGPVPLYMLKTSVKLRARHMLGHLLKRSRALIRGNVLASAARVIRGHAA